MPIFLFHVMSGGTWCSHGRCHACRCRKGWPYDWWHTLRWRICLWSAPILARKLCGAWGRWNLPWIAMSWFPRSGTGWWWWSSLGLTAFLMAARPWRSVEAKPRRAPFGLACKARSMPEHSLRTLSQWHRRSFGHAWMITFGKKTGLCPIVVAYVVCS